MEQFPQSLDENEGFMSVEPIEKELSPPNITWQHTWSFDEIRGALSESVFAGLPNEIILCIFKLLSVRDLCNISLVCRWFKLIADQDEIWQLKHSTPTRLYSKSSKQVYMDWMYMKCVRNLNLRMRNWSRYACGICDSSPCIYPIRPFGKHPFDAIGGFHQHPNSSSSMSIELSVDIDKTARQLIKLLEKASKFQQQWQQPSVLKQMITRYYRFMWLKAFYPSDMLLIPTLDIEIVWQTHLLRPAMYQADCIRLFRRVIDHSLLMSDIHTLFKDQAFRDTCELYEQQYGEQYCPLPSNDREKEVASNLIYYKFDRYGDIIHACSYWDETHFEFSPEPRQDYQNPFSFTEADLVMDRKWLGLCKQFMSDALKKVLTEDYHHTIWRDIDLSSDAMERLKKSYERFLYMAAKHPVVDGHDFISPTYSIDIICRSHMQEPLNYVTDCIQLVGYVLYPSSWAVIDDKKRKNVHDQRNISWKDEFEADLMIDHLFDTVDHRSSLSYSW